jgi:alpha-tubulin suppressor-like RCC1 family protein
LGLGDTTNRNQPTLISNNKMMINKIFTGGYHNILLNNNNLYSFGLNNVNFLITLVWSIRSK